MSTGDLAKIFIDKLLSFEFDYFVHFISEFTHYVLYNQ